MANREFNVELKGRFHWEPFLDLDNTGNPLLLKRDVEVLSEVCISYEEMIRSLESSAIVTLAFNIGGIIDIISVQVNGDINPLIKARYESISKIRSEHREQVTTKEPCEVEPNACLKLYRLVFEGPGVTYSTGKLSSARYAVPDVSIEIKGRLLPVLKDIEVVYTSQSVSPPANIIKEPRGHNSNINLGHGGMCVWLLPIWTQDVSQGATGIQFVIQSVRNDIYRNLAEGPEGNFRYLKMLRDPRSKQRITEVALWRRVNGTPDSGDWPGTSGGWMFNTNDINEGREGEDNLFVVWNGIDIK